MPVTYPGIVARERPLGSLEYSPQLLKEADKYYDSGLNYINAEDYKNALEKFLAAVDIYNKFHKEEQIAYCYDKIGLCYLKRRAYTESLEYLTRAYNKRCEMYPEGRHPEIVISLNSLAAYFDSIGRHGDADLYKEKAAEARRLIGEVKDPEFATSVNNVGVSYLRLGEIKLALDFVNQASYQMLFCSLNFITFKELGNFDSLFFNF